MTGLPFDGVRALIQGPVGSQVMLALLRPEAQPEDLHKPLQVTVPATVFS